MNPDTPYIKFGDLNLGDKYYIVRKDAKSIEDVTIRTVKALSSYREDILIFHGNSQSTTKTNKVSKAKSKEIMESYDQRDSFEVFMNFGDLLTADPRCAIFFLQNSIRESIKSKKKRIEELLEEIETLSATNSKVNIQNLI